MTTLFNLANQLTSAWATATELAPLLLVPAAIWALRIAFELAERIEQAIRFTYNAGRLAGRLWFTHGLPALLAAADWLSWANSQIDWQQVRSTVKGGLVIITTTLITLAQLALPLLIAFSERLGKAYAALITLQAKRQVQAQPLLLAAAQPQSQAKTRTRKTTTRKTTRKTTSRAALAAA